MIEFLQKILVEMIKTIQNFSAFVESYAFMTDFCESSITETLGKRALRLKIKSIIEVYISYPVNVILEYFLIEMVKRNIDH